MRARNLLIHPVLNGFSVTVGCQQVVITSIAELGREIMRYYENPAAVEKEYQSRAINKGVEEGCDVAEPPPQTLKQAAEDYVRGPRTATAIEQVARDAGF